MVKCVLAGVVKLPDGSVAGFLSDRAMAEREYAAASLGWQEAQG